MTYGESGEWISYTRWREHRRGVCAVARCIPDLGRRSWWDRCRLSGAALGGSSGASRRHDTRGMERSREDVLLRKVLRALPTTACAEWFALMELTRRRLCGRTRRRDNQLYRSNSFKFERFEELTPLRTQVKEDFHSGTNDGNNIMLGRKKRSQNSKPLSSRRQFVYLLGTAIF